MAGRSGASTTLEHESGKGVFPRNWAFRRKTQKSNGAQGSLAGPASR
jgi:hypothetical protein